MTKRIQSSRLRTEDLLLQDILGQMTVMFQAIMGVATIRGLSSLILPEYCNGSIVTAVKLLIIHLRFML